MRRRLRNPDLTGGTPKRGEPLAERNHGMGKHDFRRRGVGRFGQGAGPLVKAEHV
jgi:hypothetical protein